MLKSGMGGPEVIENLRQLGVGNPEAVFKKATDTLTPIVPSAAQPAPENMFSKQAVSAFSAGADDKLDEAIALLKALAETNKKILEASRDILLRLKS